MIRRPPRSTRTDTLFPYTTLFRSRAAGVPTSTVSRIANGTVDPTVAMLSRLVEASDATLDLSVTFHANAPATDPANLTLAEAARHLAEQCEVESVQRTIVHDFIRGSNETHFTRRRSLVAAKPEPTGDPRYDRSEKRRVGKECVSKGRSGG